MNIRIHKYLPYIVVIIFSTTCYALFVNEVDYLQVFFMALFSILFIAGFRYRKNDIYLYLIIFFQIVSILYTGVFSISSFFYGLMFMFTFLYYKDAVNRKIIELPSLIILLKYIIFAYAIVQTIQFVSVNIGLPAFNYYGVEENGVYRYNALSNEPSHTSRICLIIIIAYMYLWQIQNNRRYSIKNVIGSDKWIWLSYIYILVMSTSATAFIVLPFTFLFFIKPKTIILSISAFVILGWGAIEFIDYPAFVRIRELVPVLFTLDPDMIAAVDNSGSARINPFLYYFNDFDIESFKFWFGFGRGYSEPMLIERVLGHSTDWEKGAGGVFPIFFYDYGLLAGISFLFFLYHFCLSKKCKMFFFIWIIFISSGSLNSYYQWLFICLSYTCIFFIRNSQNDLKNGFQYNRVK